jgi:hypothetical protein
VATKKKLKAKIHKARVVKVEKLTEDKHLVAAEFEVHGPAEELPPLAAPIEISKEAEPGTPEKHWLDSLINWLANW